LILDGMNPNRLLKEAILTAIYYALIRIFEVSFIIPLLSLPSDFCYYHTHKAPVCVNLFYLDGMGHITTFNGVHLFVLFLISATLSILTLRKVAKMFRKQNRNSQ